MTRLHWAVSMAIVLACIVANLICVAVFIRGEHVTGACVTAATSTLLVTQFVELINKYRFDRWIDVLEKLKGDRET